MRSETTLCFPAEHPAFAGHFPGSPIVPGVLLLDAAVHAAREALQSGPGAICQVGSAKFLSPAGPGEMLKLALDITPPGNARFEITSGERKVAAGTLVLAAPP